MIRATNGLSNGIVPWLRTLDSSVAAVNQGGKRKGACCVYLEPWHADIEQFLELRENTGDLSRRTYNLNLANWIPDLFMQRVEEDDMWSLFDPKDVPHLPDLFGDEFAEAYEKAEAEKLYRRQIKARDLYARMMRSLAETGNGWMTFKDAMQPEMQPDRQSRAISSILSNLCTEITEVTSQDQTAVCNLGSINLAQHVSTNDGVPRFNFDKLAAHGAHRNSHARSRDRHQLLPDTAGSEFERAVATGGPGHYGLAGCLFSASIALRLAARRKSFRRRIQEEIYYQRSARLL